jgi:hypothetical protein
LARLIEAKDLLYRSGKKTPHVKTSDALPAVMALLEDFPCLPVVGDGGRVLGLLFVHNVRLAYERQVARSALVPARLKV